MFARMGKVLSSLARRMVPDPFVLALGLTLLVFALGLSVVELRRELSLSRTAWLLLA